MEGVTFGLVGILVMLLLFMYGMYREINKAKKERGEI